MNYQELIEIWLSDYMVRWYRSKKGVKERKNKMASAASPFWVYQKSRTPEYCSALFLIPNHWRLPQLCFLSFFKRTICAIPQRTTGDDFRLRSSRDKLA